MPCSSPAGAAPYHAAHLGDGAKETVKEQTDFNQQVGVRTSSLKLLVTPASTGFKNVDSTDTAFNETNFDLYSPQKLKMMHAGASLRTVSAQKNSSAGTWYNVNIT